ncbi:MAG: DNA replication/repair protein RecF [Streptococcaceae bacterium]|jgi:DNA replication and repair protein RecF|nr:DNA replication/repair protein RecF [Streptococcaceae bacterium]
MILETLHLKNFRNYETLDLELNPQLNLFVGPNAQGKTNALEAIYFLATTRSHRTHHDRELMRWESSEMRVSAIVKKNHTTLPLDVTMTAKGRVASVNHLKETRLADYIGQLNVILFAPEDLELIKGSPAGRRRFLDMEIGQVDSLYLYDVLRYNRVLKERNSYVRLERAQIDPIFLDVLDAQLLEYGTKVINGREKFVAKLQQYAAEIHAQLTHSLEELKITYQPKTTADRFQEQLTERRNLDLMRHQTSIGPHRDELTFHVNGINVADFGSQGQQRTVALSVKLAEIELMHAETGEYPILLLDDVMSELDNTRQLDLLDAALDKTQTFITTTTLDHLQNLPDKLQIFNVINGHIKNA